MLRAAGGGQEVLCRSAVMLPAWTSPATPPRGWSWLWLCRRVILVLGEEPGRAPAGQPRAQPCVLRLRTGWWQRGSQGFLVASARHRVALGEVTAGRTWRNNPLSLLGTGTAAMPAGTGAGRDRGLHRAESPFGGAGLSWGWLCHPRWDHQPGVT